MGFWGGLGVEYVYHVSHTGALGWVFLHTPLGVQIFVGLQLWLVGVPGPHTKQGIALQCETAAAVVGLNHGHGYDDGLGYLLLAVIFKIEIVHTLADSFYEGLLVVVMHQGFHQAKTPGAILQGVSGSDSNFLLDHEVGPERARRKGNHQQ